MSLITVVLFTCIWRLSAGRSLLNNLFGPVDYRDGLHLDVFANFVLSSKNSTFFKYNNLPFCRPKFKVIDYHDNLFYFQENSKREYTGYQLKIPYAEKGKTLCIVTHEARELELIRYLIAGDYRIPFSVDTMDSSTPQHNENKATVGHPMGYRVNDGGHYCIYNHLMFIISYNTPRIATSQAISNLSRMPFHHVVGFEVLPKSITSRNHYQGEVCRSKEEGGATCFTEKTSCLTVAYTYDALFNQSTTLWSGRGRKCELLSDKDEEEWCAKVYPEEFEGMARPLGGIYWRFYFLLGMHLIFLFSFQVRVCLRLHRLEYIPNQGSARRNLASVFDISSSGAVLSGAPLWVCLLSGSGFQLIFGTLPMLPIIYLLSGFGEPLSVYNFFASSLLFGLLCSSLFAGALARAQYKVLPHSKGELTAAVSAVLYPLIIIAFYIFCSRSASTYVQYSDTDWIGPTFYLALMFSLGVLGANQVSRDGTVDWLTTPARGEARLNCCGQVGLGWWCAAVYSLLFSLGNTVLLTYAGPYSPILLFIPSSFLGLFASNCVLAVLAVCLYLFLHPESLENGWREKAFLCASTPGLGVFAVQWLTFTSIPGRSDVIEKAYLFYLGSISFGLMLISGTVGYLYALSWVWVCAILRERSQARGSQD